MGVKTRQIVPSETSNPLWFPSQIRHWGFQWHPSNVPLLDQALFPILHAAFINVFHSVTHPGLKDFCREEIIWQSNCSQHFSIHNVAIDVIGTDATFVDGSRSPVPWTIHPFLQFDITHSIIAIEIVNPFRIARVVFDDIAAKQEFSVRRAQIVWIRKTVSPESVLNSFLMCFAEFVKCSDG